MLPSLQRGGDLWRIDASAEFKHQCLPFLFFFLCARRAFNYLLQKPFFPLHCDAACRLHLFDNQPPARRLRDTVWLQTRTKCMGTVFSRRQWHECGKLQENTGTQQRRGVLSQRRLNLWPGGCSSVPLSARNTAVNEPKRYWFLLKRPLIIFLLLSVNRQPIDQRFLLPRSQTSQNQLPAMSFFWEQ